MNGPYVRPLDGSMSDDPDERVLEAIFGVVGACEHHLPRRVPATTLIKSRVVGSAIIASCDETEPFDTEHRVCDSCRDEYLDPAASDPRPEWAVVVVSVEAL